MSQPNFLPPVAQHQVTSGKSIWSLVLGILSFFFALLTGIPAIILGILALRDIRQRPQQLTGDGLAIAGIVTGALGTVMSVGCMVALLLPAVQAAREAARRNLSMNNMKVIGLGMANHHDVKQVFPAIGPNADEEGTKLSWRVHLLPYLEQQALYEQFHLDEPWDSAHNKALLAQMPACYESQSDAELPPGHTVYLAVTGPQALFRDIATPTGLAQCDDGTSNTIWLVEADAELAVPWTQPADYEVDPANPAKGLGSLRHYGWLAGRVDCSVGFITNDTPPQVVEALMTSDGGEDVR